MAKTAAQSMKVVLVLVCSMLCSTHANLQDETCTADGEPCVFGVAWQGVAAEAAANGSATSWLQHQHRRAPKSKSTKSTDIFLAFEGGGMASLVLFSGFFSGLLNVLGQETSTVSSVTFANSQLFDNVASITSTSGGSWMAGGLLYSSQYMTTLESIAQNPSDAADIYNTGFITPLFGADQTIAVQDILLMIKQCLLGVIIPAHLIPNSLVFVLFEGLVTTLTGSLGGRVLEDLFLFAFFWIRAQGENGAAQYNWREFVAALYSKGFLLNDDATLGSAPNAFFNGKMWFPVTSQANPARGNKVFAYLRTMLYEPFRAYFTYYKRQRPGDEPTCVGTPIPLLCEVLDLVAPTASQAFYGPHLFTPARFSFTLGSGTSGTAPLSFCDEGGTCGGRRNQYQSRTRDWPFWSQIVLAPQTVGEFTAAAIDAQAGKLPVSSVAAASSALAAGLSLYPFYGAPPSCSLSGNAVAIGSAPDGDAFKAARDFITNERFNMQNGQQFTTADLLAGAQMNFEVLADGAYTDNTGVMTAVGEGATTVFSLVYDASAFINCFTPPFDIAPYAAYYVFEESQEFVTWQLDKGSSRLTWPIPGLSSQYLKGITYGSFTATTRDSRDSELFGITPNQQITLEWVSFESTVGILEPLFHGDNVNAGQALAEAYGELVAEVVSCLAHPDNNKATKSILNYMGVSFSV